MATTQNTFTGNGSNLGPFSFTFKWLESTDIKVTVAGVLKTAGTHYNLQSLNYSTKTGGQVLFTAGNAPANGAAIVIYRQTDDTDLAATFYSGSAIRAQDLNNNFIQGLYVTQESSNNAAAATTAANATTTTANTALSNSTAAQASAASAISTANSAVSTANSAVSTANSAVSTANSASAAAASAVSTANTANSTASSALSAVSEALAYTTVANVAAIPGSPTNGDALRITNSTGIESFTPLIGVPGGFVGNSALTVEIYYNGTSSTWIWSRYFPNDPENRYWAGSVVVSDTAPLSPTNNSLWYDGIGGRFYIRYNDGNTSQWVDASPQGNRTSTFLAGTAALPGLTPEGDTDTGIYSPGANQLSISTGGSARATIDASGRLLIGTSSVISNNFSGTAHLLQVVKNDFLPIGFYTYSNTAGENGYCPYVELNRARGTQASPSAVSSSDDLGIINFYGYDSSAFSRAASIKAVVDGGVSGAGDMPGRLVFSTTADGASSPTERVRITQNGYFKASNNGSYVSTTAAYHEFTQDGTLETAYFRSSNASPVGIIIYYSAVSPNGTGNYFLTCFDSGSTLRAGIRSNGGLANYSANNANLSDINAKKDISPAADTWNCLKEWEIVNYRYKDQPDDADLNLGVIAQQVAESCPEVITVFSEAKEATEDQPAQEERLGVKEQQMYWMAIKALQEAIGRIETLETQNASQAATIASFEARLTALEGGTN